MKTTEQGQGLMFERIEDTTPLLKGVLQKYYSNIIQIISYLTQFYKLECLRALLISEGKQQETKSACTQSPIFIFNPKNLEV